MALDLPTYASWFRNATPYIQAHRGSTFVVLLPQATLAHDNLINLAHDLALLQVLGVKLVLVPAHRSAAQLAQLQDLFQDGLPNTPLHGTHIPMTTCVLDTATGADQTSPIQEALYAGQLVLAVGDPAAEVAGALALSLGAEKLILFNSAGLLRDADGSPSSMLTPDDLRTYIGSDSSLSLADQAGLNAAADCVSAGVPRAHVVSHAEDGALLGELFTAEGHGTQISEEQQTPMRTATVDDLEGLKAIIRPLEEKGALIRRTDEELTAELDSFLVVELDGFVIGCCLVNRIEGSDAAELGCVAVAASYRQSHNRQRTSIGSRLLANAEQRAKKLGSTALFALTTGPVTWFEEHGFAQVTVADLPAAKQSRYNHQRQSKVLRKRL